jgi:hypothetical protein
LVDVWNNSLLPQLIEYFAGRTAQLLSVLGDPSDFVALEVAQPEAEWEFLGASAFVRSRPQVTSEDVLKLLLRVARIAEPESE